jgi:hypothetical protein
VNSGSFFDSAVNEGLTISDIFTIPMKMVGIDFPPDINLKRILPRSGTGH